MPQQYRTTSAIRDNNAETFLSQVVSNPFQGLTPETPGSNGATIARRRLLLQHPQFDTLTRRGLSRLEHLPRAAGASREAIHRWIDAAVVLHVLAVPRKGRAAQPVGGSGRPGWLGRSAASHHACRRRRAAVWPRTQMGQRLERRARSDPRRLAVQHEVRVAVRRAARLQPEHLLRSDVRRSDATSSRSGARTAARITASTCRSSTPPASTRRTDSRSGTRPARS